MNTKVAEDYVILKVTSLFKKAFELFKENVDRIQRRTVNDSDGNTRKGKIRQSNAHALEGVVFRKVNNSVLEAIPKNDTKTTSRLAGSATLEKRIKVTGGKLFDCEVIV